MLVHIQFYVLAGHWGCSSAVEPLPRMHNALGSVPKAGSKMVYSCCYVPSGSIVADNLFDGHKAFLDARHLIYWPNFKMLCVT